MRWKTALYDTLSLVMLDEIFQRDSGVSGRLPGIFAVEASFLPTHMRVQTAERMKSRSEILHLPGFGIVSGILRDARLPITMAEIDRLVFAAAVHYEVAVVTGDERFEGALRSAQVPVSHLTAFLRKPERLLTRTKGGH